MLYNNWGPDNIGSPAAKPITKKGVGTVGAVDTTMYPMGGAMTEQEMMLAYQDLDFNEGANYAYADGSHHFTSSSSIFDGLNGLIGGLGSLYTNYNNQEYQKELQELQLEKLKTSFDTPITTQQKASNKTALYVVGGVIGAVILIKAIK